MVSQSKARTVIGWREWIELPELCASRIKAKVDTGARTSALHALDLRISEAGGARLATFTIHPMQRSAKGATRIECPIHGFRRVRSSNGRVETRPWIVTLVRAGGVQWPIEITLAARDEMGFRMLLGRAALRRRFLVDPGRSFLAGRPPRARRRKERKKP